MFRAGRLRDGRFARRDRPLFAGRRTRWRPIVERRCAAYGLRRVSGGTSGRTTSCTIRGMAEKVTLSLSPDTLARARAAAAQAGMSLSAWMDRAARREALRDAGRRQDDWLAANPDVRDQLDEFDRLADKLESGWSDLADAA